MKQFKVEAKRKVEKYEMNVLDCQNYLLNSIFKGCMVLVFVWSLIHSFIYARSALQAGDAMMHMTSMVPDLKELEA